MALKYFFVLLSCMALQLHAQSYIPPKLTVFAGEDQTLKLPDNSTGLKVDVKGAEGKIMYRWEKFSGPGQYRISTPDKAKTKVGELVAGEYVFMVTVIDSRQATGMDTVRVRVKGDSKNRPPIADAGPDQTIIIPANSVVLNGKGSNDPDPNGSITSYQWSLISGPVKPVIDSPNSSTTQVYNLAKGTYQFLLRVIDETREASDRDTVNIRVIEKEYNPPIVDAGDDIMIQLPTNKAKLLGKVTSTDGKIRAIQWSQIEGPNQATLAVPDKAQTEVSNLVKGVYQFELTVTDDHKLTGRDRVTVSVLPIKPDSKNVPPTVIAGDDVTITLPENTVELSATASDAEGSVLRIQWSETSGNPNIQIANKNKLNATANNLAEGVFQFKIVVTDKNGATGQDFITVKVDPAINNPPIADAGADITITFTENLLAKLVGRFSDPDGGDTITSFLWSKKFGPDSISIVDSSKAITEANFLGAGVYQFEFLVTDNHGATSKDEVNITVNRVIPPDPDPTPSPLVPLLILAGVGLAVAAVGSYFFFLWWPVKKVMVFFMHPDEEAFAHSLLPGSEKTEGYLIDHCNKGTIRKLTEKGIAVHVLNTTNLVINTPGKTSSFHFSLKKGKHELKSVKEEAKPGIRIRNMIIGKAVDHAGEFPSFYLITLDAPLLPVFQKKLESIGLSVIQRVPENSYILYVSDADQLKQLRSSDFNFIRLINYYSSLDTGLMVREAHFLNAVQEGGQIVLDLILHREEDSDKVLSMLRERDINILGNDRNRIRISIPARAVEDYNLSDNIYIQAIYEYIPPELYNDLSRQLIGIESTTLQKGMVSETGAGEIVGVADTGIDLEHPDIKSHIIDAVAWGRKQTGDTSDPNGHGTHVTGTIVGDGAASGGKIKGIAPAAKVFFQSIMDDAGSISGFEMRLQELFLEAYQKGARVHNNSWGSAAEARYTMETTIVDEFMFEHPDMLIVISAGNEGVNNFKVVSEKGYVSFGSIGSPATTKNGLTVGASRSNRKSGGYSSSTYGKIWPDRFPDPPTSLELVSGDSNSIAAYSSRGRCDDYRMKPDIVAPGTDILSTRSKLAPLNKFHGGYAEYNDAYAFLGGTSMAAPMVSGAAALVREYYKTKKGCQKLSAALVKATLINGTRKLTGPSAIHGRDVLPNPNQGYGMLDLSMTIPNDNNRFQLEFRDSFQDPSVVVSSTGQAYALPFRTKQVSWIRVCMAWTDYPDRSIQNDLDLMVDYEPTRQKWSGNIGINAEDPYGGTDEDRTNNMEIIRIENAQPGLYTVKVFAHNLPKGRQGFALVVTTSDMSATF